MHAYRWLAIALAAGFSGFAAGAGNIDAEFGGNGRAITAFDLGGGDTDDALAMDRMTNGKIVVAGAASVDANHICIAVARLNADGTADTSFGSVGKFSLPSLCSGASLRINAIKADTAGRIVFAGIYRADGHQGGDFVVGRIKADGSGLDDSFGSFPSIGIVTPNIGGGTSDAAANAIALQSDGKIVVAGYGTTNFIGSLTGYVVVRLNANGSNDSTFGSSGYQIYSWGTSINDPLNDVATAVAIQGDGKIVVAGTSQQTASGADFGVIRLNPNGSFDTGFGGHGTGATLINFGGACQDDIATAVVPRYNLFNPAGSGVVIAGTHCLSGSDWDFAVAVLDADGLLDAGFNGTGRRTLGIDLGGFNRDVAKSVSLESIGDLVFFPTHILLGGFAYNSAAGAGYDFALARLSLDGTLDTSFGNNGRASFGLNLGGSDDFGNAIVANGRNAWIAGTVQRAAPGDFDFGVLRIFANDVIFGSRFERH